METIKENLGIEFARRASVRARMLFAFKKHGELNTRDLMRFGPGLSSRLHELREDGHKIVTVYEKPGLFRYVYLGQVEEDDASVGTVD